MTAGSVILQGPGTPRVHSRGAQPAPRCCDPRSPVPVSAPDADAILLLIAAHQDNTGGYELRRALRRGARALLGHDPDAYNRLSRQARQACHRAKENGERRGRGAAS